MQQGPADQGRRDRPLAPVAGPPRGLLGDPGQGQLGRPVRPLAQRPGQDPGQPEPEQGHVGPTGRVRTAGPTGTVAGPVDRVLGRREQAGQLAVQPGQRFGGGTDRGCRYGRVGLVVQPAVDPAPGTQHLVHGQCAGQVVVEGPAYRRIAGRLGQRLGRALHGDQPDQVVLPVPAGRRLLQQPHLDQPVQRPGHPLGVHLAEQCGDGGRVQPGYRQQAQGREDPVRLPVHRIGAVPQPVVPDPDAPAHRVPVHAQLVQPVPLVT